MKLRVVVDREKCCGAGQCVLAAPEVFEQRDDGLVALLDEQPPEAEHAAVHEAADVCPTGAIELVPHA